MSGTYNSLELEGTNLSNAFAWFQQSITMDVVLMITYSSVVRLVNNPDRLGLTNYTIHVTGQAQGVFHIINYVIKPPSKLPDWDSRGPIPKCCRRGEMEE